MSFKLKLNVTESTDCESLKLCDATGLWDSAINPTGWNNPSSSITISNVTASTLIVTFPDLTTKTIDLSALTYPVLIPNSTEEATKLTAVDLGLTGKLPYGIYIFAWDVTLNTPQGVKHVTTSETVFIYCTLTCCLNRLLAKVQVPDEDCADCKDNNKAMKAKNQLINDAFIILEAAKAAAACAQLTRVKELADYVNTICSNLDCGCT